MNRNGDFSFDELTRSLVFQCSQYILVRHPLTKLPLIDDLKNTPLYVWHDMLTDRDRAHLIAVHGIENKPTGA